MIRRMLLVMSRSELLARVASTNRLARSTARRFVAGETLDEALHAVGILNAGGLLATLDLLGENVTTARLHEPECSINPGLL